MEQHCYLVTYDISEPKRWRHVYRTMCGYGEWLQYSVFRCDLTETRLVSLRGTLDGQIHHKEDSVLFARIGPTGADTLDKFETLGRPRKLALPGPKIL